MTTLLIAPDFFSHYQPLSIVARTLRDAGERVVVATGPAMTPAARSDGFECESLVLAAGSNTGLARAADHDRGDDGALQAFIDATREGIAPALIHQATKRRRELLWQPIATGHRILEVVEKIQPDHLIVDQVSLVSTLGAVASGRSFITIVPGHPVQLPVGDELYGDLPVGSTLGVSDEGREALRQVLDVVNTAVTADFNDALERLAPGAVPAADAFRVCGDLVGYHWETELHDPARRMLLPSRHVDLGPLVRVEALPPDLSWLALPGPPIVSVALGTFLSHRVDVLEAVISALRQLPVRAVIAVGDNDVRRFGAIPEGWTLRERIPQVAVLGHASCAVSHAGNNSVQEALRFGVRQVLLPMSTDQPAIAADLARVGAATVIDPNAIDPNELAGAINGAIDEAIERGALSPPTSHLPSLVAMM